MIFVKQTLRTKAKEEKASDILEAFHKGRNG
jgi:hypothetical protein